MKNPIPQFFLPTIITGILTFCSGSPEPFFEQKWGIDFHLRPIETGDTLSIGAVFCDGKSVFLHDRAAGTMIVLDARGRKSAAIPLAGIGRDTYCGDDFIVRDSAFIFVNSVDKRFEYFSYGTGKHTDSRPLPLEALKAQPKRSWRIIDRIELAGDTVLVGNAHVLVALEPGLKKVSGAGRTLTAPAATRFALVRRHGPLLLHGDSLAQPGSPRKTALPGTHFPIPGKRLFVLGGAPHAVIAGTAGISIRRIPAP